MERLQQILPSSNLACGQRNLPNREEPRCADWEQQGPLASFSHRRSRLRRLHGVVDVAIARRGWFQEAPRGCARTCRSWRWICWSIGSGHGRICGLLHRRRFVFVAGGWLVLRLLLLGNWRLWGRVRRHARMSLRMESLTSLTQEQSRRRNQSWTLL